jgi:hypothetical protein
MIQMNAKALENATTKAIAAHCKVRVLGWKRYAVSSGPGKAEYTVTFHLRFDGWHAECHCRAAAHYHACYHCVSAWTVFTAHRAQRDEAARKRSSAARDHEVVIYSDGRSCCETWTAKNRACPLSKVGKGIFSAMSAAAMAA